MDEASKKVNGPESHSMSGQIAVYTVVHPGVREFVQDWYRSVASQTDRDFDLWISLDSLTPTQVMNWIGQKIDAEWIESQPCETPAGIRSRALERLCKEYEAIVLVDSDDLLWQSRVAGARAALGVSDLAGCELRLVDQQGRETGVTLALPKGSSPETVLPRNNIFGLSNSAYRCELLHRCLPIPDGVALVDWFLATKTWLAGGRMVFDPAVRMDYRQHGTNMARVTYPTSPERVKKDTELVRRHFGFVLAGDKKQGLPERWRALERVAAEVEIFHERVALESEQLDLYVAALNRLRPAPLWWSSVAHPALASIWQRVEEHQICNQ